MLNNTFTNLMLNSFSMLGATSDNTANDISGLVHIFEEVIFSILIWVLVIVAAVGTIYAVILGINMAKADNAEKREEAKKRVIYTVIGFAIAIVLIIVFMVISKNIEKIITSLQGDYGKADVGQSSAFIR